MLSPPLKLHKNKILLFIAFCFSAYFVYFYGNYLTFHSGSRLLAATLSEEIIIKVCKTEFRPGHPCGDKNVMWEADLGVVIYIYVCGVIDNNEISSIVSDITLLRNKYGRSEIPIHISFYEDLKRSHEIKTIKLKGE